MSKLNLNTSSDRRRQNASSSLSAPSQLATQSKTAAPPQRQETLISEAPFSAPLTGARPDTARTEGTARSPDSSDRSPSTSEDSRDSDTDSGSESHSDRNSDSEAESDSKSASGDTSVSESGHSSDSESEDNNIETENKKTAHNPEVDRHKKEASNSLKTREKAGKTRKDTAKRGSSLVQSGKASEDSSDSIEGSEGTDSSDESGSDTGSGASDAASDSGTESESDQSPKKIVSTSDKRVAPENEISETPVSADRLRSTRIDVSDLKSQEHPEGAAIKRGRSLRSEGSGSKQRIEAKEKKRRHSQDQTDEKEVDSKGEKKTLKRRERTRTHFDNEKREAEEDALEKESQKKELVPNRIPTKRNLRQNMIRYASLYIVPVLVSIPISLLLSLNASLLTPLYNTTPLTLHNPELYAFYVIPPSVIYWYSTLSASPRDRISARVCFSLAALSGDAVVVCGRRVGSILGKLLGPEWGAVAARAVLGVGIVGGGVGFALLCFDHISAVPPATKMSDRPRNMGSILYRTAFFLAHVYVGERFWTSYLSRDVTMLNSSPEKTMLFISLLLTLLSLFLRPGSSATPFSTQVHTFISTTLGLSPQASKALSRITIVLPRQAFPILLLLRIPLLVLALRQQIFLRPPSSQPYITANGELRVISSERSLTGQIVVADNLRDGYRFLRADHSILGGRWIRDVDDKSAVGGKRTDMGDSIFATFNLQEVAVLAHRSDPSESLAKTLSLTTDLEVSLEGAEEDEDEQLPDRALIIGLGVGIAASSFAKRGMYVDVVEIDPAVYLAAQKHFELPHDHLASTNILDGSTFIAQLASMKRDNETDPELIPKWDIVIQDCFTGGSVPGEMFTLEFWEDVGELMKDDGIVAMNFAGILKSKASKAVLVTLLPVFPQCRAFGDGFEKDQGPDDLVNMVVFCTKAHSPLLTFRKPTRQDALRSPLRAHVYSTFHPHEIQLDTIVSERDFQDPQLMLRRGNGQAQRDMDRWQVGSGMATWRAMQKILTPDMWLAY
ncbi:hypothetical protein IAU59_006572 [Kwoniella sp. CBS 9459]